MNVWDIALLIGGVTAFVMIVLAFRLVSERFTYEMMRIAEEREDMDIRRQKTEALLAEAVDLLREVRRQQAQGPSTTNAQGLWWMERADDVIRDWEDRRQETAR